MINEDIKKELCKQKPTAIFNVLRDEVAQYSAVIQQGEVFFEIPASDIRGANFTRLMDAQHLNKWITEIIEKK